MRHRSDEHPAMSLFRTIGWNTAPPTARSELSEPLPAWIVAAGVLCAYYIGARFGFALTLGANPISVLWPPNALLMAALLITPAHHWRWLVLAAFPAHLLAARQSDVPLVMVLCWFVSNVTEALIGAYLVRSYSRGQPSLTNLRSVAVLVLCAALAAPFVSSFLDAAFVVLVGWGSSSYSELWAHRFNSNLLATLTIVPLVLAWTNGRDRDLAFGERRLEGGLLLICLLVVCTAVFAGAVEDRLHVEALLYLPLPFLLWAALRFGPLGTSTAFAIVVFVTILGATRGRGPFVTDLASESALVVQIFLVSVGAPLLFLAAVMNERKQAVARSAASEERFASVFGVTPDPMVIFRSADGAVLDANETWENVFGAAREDLLGTTLRLSAVSGSMDAGAGAESQIVEMSTRDGVSVQTVWSTRSLRLAGEECTVAIVRDVTEQRRTEAELREQRNELLHVTRVANLSAMASSLAHELVQPLTAILTNTQVARRLMAHKPVDYPEISEILDDIVEDDKRAGEVIRRLRSLMKKTEPAFDLVSLNDVVNDTLMLAHGELVVQGVMPTANLGTGLLLVNGDRVQLQQVLLNLVSNACEAMRAVPRWRRSLLVSTEAPTEGFVCLTVSDSGPGPSSEDQQEIFDPFFTTKEDGLGMGLTICRSIVEAHGGTIEATQNSPRGMTLRVFLPPAASIKGTPLESPPWLAAMPLPRRSVRAASR
jgi:two-component system, LuxR family, sensor kinase FixL